MHVFRKTRAQSSEGRIQCASHFKDRLRPQTEPWSTGDQLSAVVDAHQSPVRSTYVHVASCSGLGAPKWTTHTPVCQTSQNSHRWRTRFELSPASNQISTRVVGTVDTTYICARENVTPVRPAWQAGQHQHQNRHYGVHRFSILVGPLH